MPYSVATIPHDFPLHYVLNPVVDESGCPNGHQLYVKERWRGYRRGDVDPFADQRNNDGSVGEYWGMGCLLGDACDGYDVLTTNELLDQLKRGRVIGRRDPATGLVVITG